MAQTQVKGSSSFTPPHYPMSSGDFTVPRRRRALSPCLKKSTSNSSVRSVYGFPEEINDCSLSLLHSPLSANSPTFYGFPDSPTEHDVLPDVSGTTFSNKTPLDLPLGKERSSSPTDSYSELFLDKDSICRTYISLLKMSIELKLNSIMLLSSGLIARESDFKDMGSDLLGAGISVIPCIDGIGSCVTAIGKYVNSSQHKKKWRRIALNLSVSALSVSELSSRLSLFWVNRNRESLVKSVLVLMLREGDSDIVLQRMRRSSSAFADVCLEICAEQKIPRALLQVITTHIEVNYEFRATNFFVKKSKSIPGPKTAQFPVACVKRTFRGASVSFLPNVN